MNPRNKFPYVLGVILVLLGVAMSFPFAGGAAPGPQTGSQGPPSRAPELPNFDAFGSSNRRSAAAAQAAAVLKSRRPPRQIAALAYVAFRFTQRPDGTTEGKLS